MLKEAGGVVGGALVFSPLGMPLLFHGVAGVLVGGAGLFVVNAVARQVVEVVGTKASQPQTEDPEE